MPFEGVNFDNQQCLAKDDGAVYAALLTDGVLSGCSISFSGGNVSVGAGRLMIKGRQVRVPSTQTSALSQTSGYARIRIRLDMTAVSEEDDFRQVVSAVDYASTVGGFPALVQTDINAAGSYYDFVLCVVSLGSLGVTGIVSAPPAAGPRLTGAIVLTSDSYGYTLPASAQQGQLFFKLRA